MPLTNRSNPSQAIEKNQHIETGVQQYGGSDIGGVLVNPAAEISENEYASKGSDGSVQQGKKTARISPADFPT